MPKAAAPPLPEGATSGQIARLTGVTERTIAGRRQDGRLPVREDGSLDLVAIVRAGITALAEQQKGEGGTTLDAARVAVLHEQRDRLAMMNAQLRGDAVAAEDLETVVAAVFDATRAKMLALPTKLAPIVVNLPSVIDVKEQLTAAVYEALSDLATTEVVSTVKDRARRRAGVRDDYAALLDEPVGHA